MIARGFKPVAWVAAIGTAALGCYMLSLRVASERAELTGLERKIVNTQKAIRSLQTELETRGRVTQLQQWNDDILALTPPAAGQYLESQMMLARFEARPTPALENPAEVRMAAAETPTPAPSVTPPAQRAVAAPQPPRTATVQRASLDVPTSTTEPQPRRAAPATAQPARPPAAKPATPARTRTAAAETPPRIRAAATTPPRARAAVAPPPRGRALLDERTTRDLGAASRSERRGGTRD